jgi:hypothetical protein
VQSKTLFPAKHIGFSHRFRVLVIETEIAIGFQPANIDFQLRAIG